MPSTIEQVHREFKERGLAVVAVNLEEPGEKVAAWVRESKVSFPILLDATGAVSRAYHVTVTPTVFLIGRDGRLAGKAFGTKEWTTAGGRALLQALVAR